jgi:hypothetical protein
MKLLISLLFLFATFQSITAVFGPEVVVGAFKKEDHVILGVFKTDNQGEFVAQSIVPNQIVKKYNCFGLELKSDECNFIKKMTIENQGGFLSNVMTQKYTLLHVIKVVNVKNSSSNNKWGKTDSNPIQEIMTSISNLQRKRSFNNFLSKISQGRNYPNYSTRKIKKLLTQISQKYKRQYGNPLNRRRRRNPIKNILSQISHHIRGQRRRRSINNLLSNISQLGQSNFNPSKFTNQGHEQEGGQMDEKTIKYLLKIYNQLPSTQKQIIHKLISTFFQLPTHQKQMVQKLVTTYFQLPRPQRMKILKLIIHQSQWQGRRGNVQNMLSKIFGNESWENESWN